MKVALSEKQLKLITSMVEVDGDTSASSGADTASTTSTASSSQSSGTQSSKAGYPAVDKWESGITRGPANPIGVAKWSDVVGAKLTRGHANPLKEQEVGMQPGRTTQIAQALNAPEIERKKEIDKNFNENFFMVEIPKTSKTKSSHLILPKNYEGIETKYTLHEHPINPYVFFRNWVGTEWEDDIPNQRHLEEIIPNGTLRNFTIGNIKYSTYVKRFSEKPVLWGFSWYYTDDKKPYNPKDYIKSEQVPEEYQLGEGWWSEWGQWVLTAGSILAACLIPGAQGLLISIGLDLVAAADLYVNKKDNIGAGISFILAFVPVIGNVARVGKVSKETASKLAKTFAPLKTEEEILEAMSKLPKQEQYIVQQILKQDPKALNKMITDVMSSQIANKQEAFNVVGKINELVKSGAIPKASAAAFYKNLNLKRFGFDLAISGLVIGAGAGVRYYFNKKAEEAVKQGIAPSNEDVENSALAEKIFKMNSNDFENKILPIIDKYRDMYDSVEETDNLKKFRKIMNAVYKGYIANPKSDLDAIANNIDKN